MTKILARLGRAFAAGISRPFHFPVFLLTMAVAVSPFPLIYYLGLRVNRFARGSAS